MKNKKIVMVLGIIIVVLTIIIGVLGYLYLYTDFLKTEQQLFYKYIGKVKIIDSNFIGQYNLANENISKKSSSSSANLDISMNVINRTTGTNQMQKVLSVSSNALKNSSSNQYYRDFNISSDGTNLLALKYMQDNNVYGIIADNILVKYLTIENSNLKDLASKLGAEDTTVIPDSIQTNYDEILKIDNNVLENLKETYEKLIYNNVNKDNFYKIVNEDKTETIGVSLTNKELINLVKIALETIKNDTALLNLIIAKAQLLNYKELNIENVQLEIQNVIDNITAQEITTEQEILEISLTKRGGTVEKIVIDMYQNNTAETVIKDSIEIQISELNNVNMIFKENDIELLKIMTSYSCDDTNLNFNVDIETIDEEEKTFIKTKYQINNYKTDNIVQNLNINIGTNEEESTQITLNNNITLKENVEIPKLTTENSVKLNDLTSQELNELFVALENRINEVYGQSVNMLVMMIMMMSM